MTSIKKSVVGLAASIATFVAFAGTALAQSGQNVTLCDPLGTNCQPGSESFSSIATSVAQFLVQDIAIPLSVVIVLIGSFQIMTSAGDPEKFTKGRKTIVYAAIGLIAAFISLGIVKIIQNLLGVPTS